LAEDRFICVLKCQTRCRVTSNECYTSTDSPEYVLASLEVLACGQLHSWGKGSDFGFSKLQPTLVGLGKAIETRKRIPGAVQAGQRRHRDF
jgi:hypothetical protein